MATLSAQALITVRGIVPAIATPSRADGEPDVPRLLDHARYLLANGADGLNVLGTTGQATSFSVEQRIAIMEAFANGEFRTAGMLVGTGAAALADAVRLTKVAISLGFGGTLVIPPFYYKDVDEDGIFRFYQRLIEGVNDNGLRLYLYHFPRLSGVPFTRALINRLVAAFPAIVLGLKDSAADDALLEAVHGDLPDFALFPANESKLLDSRRRGYAGCISATVNVTSALSGEVWHGELGAETSARQERLAEMRTAIPGAKLVSSLHALLARRYRDEAWHAVMPPLTPFGSVETDALRATLERLQA